MAKPRSKMSPSQRYWQVNVPPQAKGELVKACEKNGLDYGDYYVRLHEMFGEEFAKRIAKV